MTQEQHIWFIDKGFTMNQVMVKPLICSDSGKGNH